MVVKYVLIAITVGLGLACAWLLPRAIMTDRDKQAFREIGGNFKAALWDGWWKLFSIGTVAIAAAALIVVHLS